MKNLFKRSILFLALIALTVCSAEAQNANAPAKFWQYSNGTGVNYATNAGTATSYLYSPAMHSNGFRSRTVIQTWFTNLSGTAAANVWVQGSTDSVNWDYVYGVNGVIPITSYSAGITNGVDTFIYSATRTAKIFRVEPSVYKYLRLKCTGVGTHSDTLWANFREYINQD